EKRIRAPIVETLRDHWRIVGGFAGLSAYSACLSRELAPDCRWHSAITCARNQLIQHGDSAAGTDRRRMVERSRWTQASYAPCNNRGITRCLAPILAVEPSLGAARPAWAAWLRLADRYLLWVTSVRLIRK